MMFKLNYWRSVGLRPRACLHAGNGIKPAMPVGKAVIRLNLNKKQGNFPKPDGSDKTHFGLASPETKLS